ncbi:hypothetical protein RCJ22_35495 [Vibrio sp. FNV 38]|nr:hypothetical protein [Vibrio sp. FNV 38]
MDLSWVNVADTAIKIGLGALISGISTYVVLIKTQSFELKKKQIDQKNELEKLKKEKYVELLCLSEQLIQSSLYTCLMPDSVAYIQYLRIFNELQIISDDSIRVSAFNLTTEVGRFALLNKNGIEHELCQKMVTSAREKISEFQKVAQLEVMKSYPKT